MAGFNEWDLCGKSRSAAERMTADHRHEVVRELSRATPAERPHVERDLAYATELHNRYSGANWSSNDPYDSYDYSSDRAGDSGDGM